MTESKLREKYIHSALHKSVSIEDREDVSIQKYWDHWRKLYGWSSEEMLEIEVAGSVAHNKFIAGQKQNTKSTSDLEDAEEEEQEDEEQEDEEAEEGSKAEAEAEEGSQDHTEDSPEEQSAGANSSIAPEPTKPEPEVVPGTVPIAVYSGFDEREFGSLTKLQWNKESLVAEMYLPGSRSTTPSIGKNKNEDVLAVMGAAMEHMTNVRVVTPIGYVAVRVTHETIQVAPDREPVFLKLCVQYERI